VLHLNHHGRVHLGEPRLVHPALEVRHLRWRRGGSRRSFGRETAAADLGFAWVLERRRRRGAELRAEEDALCCSLWEGAERIERPRDGLDDNRFALSCLLRFPLVLT
jgi:hypothetical protein